MATASRSDKPCTCQTVTLRLTAVEAEIVRSALASLGSTSEISESVYSVYQALGNAVYGDDDYYPAQYVIAGDDERPARGLSLRKA